MRRVWFFVVVGMLGLMYYSVNRPPEIADRVMVHAVGIDSAEKEEDGYRVTLQIYSPDGGGTEGAFDPSLPNVSLIKAEGKNVSQAVRKCEDKLGGEVFLGQARMILFGKSVDLSKTDELFGYFLSNSEAYLCTDCAAAENTAEELLSIPIPSSSVSAEKFVMMIRSAEERGFTAGCSLMDILERGDGCAVMPMFSKLDDTKPSDRSGGDDDSEEQKSPEKLGTDSGLLLDKGALYLDGRRADVLSGRECGLIGMISGRGKAVFTEVDGISKTFRVTARKALFEPTDGGSCRVIRCSLTPCDDQFYPNKAEREKANNAALSQLSEETAELTEKYPTLCSSCRNYGIDRTICLINSR